MGDPSGQASIILDLKVLVTNKCIQGEAFRKGTRAMTPKCRAKDWWSGESMDQPPTLVRNKERKSTDRAGSTALVSAIPRSQEQGLGEIGQEGLNLRHQARESP